MGSTSTLKTDTDRENHASFVNQPPDGKRGGVMIPGSGRTVEKRPDHLVYFTFADSVPGTETVHAVHA